MATETAKVDLGVLEEDDEFEEFPADGTGMHTSYYVYLSLRFEFQHHPI